VEESALLPANCTKERNRRPSMDARPDKWKRGNLSSELLADMTQDSRLNETIHQRGAVGACVENDTT
jgi:hypothetical protein